MSFLSFLSLLLVNAMATPPAVIPDGVSVYVSNELTAGVSLGASGYTSDAAVFFPIEVTYDIIYDGFCAMVYTAGPALSSAELGLYTDAGGRPGTVIDSANVALTSTGEVCLGSGAFTAGDIVWGAWAPHQVVNIRALSTSATPSLGRLDTGGLSPTKISGLTLSGVTGSLPADLTGETLTAFTGLMPWLAFRVD